MCGTRRSNIKVKTSCGWQSHKIMGVRFTTAAENRLIFPQYESQSLKRGWNGRCFWGNYWKMSSKTTTDYASCLKTRRNRDWVSKFLRGVTAEMAPMKWKLRVLWKSSCVGWGFAGANPWRKVLLKWTQVWKAEADSCRNVCWSSTGERLFCWSKHERTRGVRFFTNDTRVLAALHFVVELHVLGLHREMGSKNPVGLWYSFFLP